MKDTFSNFAKNSLLTLVIVLASVFSTALQAEDGFSSFGVPEGFEDLVAEQTTLVDVFYGGLYVTTTLANFTATYVELTDPQEVVSLLNGILDPSLITSKLTGQLDAHAELICYSSTDQDCGFLATDDVGVIFDEGNFRVDVFIHSSLLEVRLVVQDKFLPPATSEFSQVTNVYAAISGDDRAGSTNSFNLTGSSVFSQKEDRVNMLWNIDNNEGAGVESLFWQRDERNLQYQAGWFKSDSRFLTFVDTDDIAGVRYGTSLSVRTDLALTRGVPLQVFLANRSRVEIFKDGRLVNSDFYDAGNQVLDTSRLPEGAYDVDIRITDLTGAEETLQRFYVKTPRIAPKDLDLFYIEAGDINETRNDIAFPKSQSEFTLRGGYSKRLQDDLGLDMALAYVKADSVWEAGLYYIHPKFEIQPRVMFSFQGDYGVSVSSFGRYKQLSGSYVLQSLWSNNHLNTDDRFRLVDGGRFNNVLNIGYPLYQGQLGFQISYSQRGESASERVISMKYDRSLFHRYTSQLDLQTEFSKSNEESLASVKLNWRWRRQRLSHRVTPELRHEKDLEQGGQNLVRVQYGGSWEDGPQYPIDLQTNWDMLLDNEQRRLSASTEARSNLGYGSLFLEHSNTDDEGTRNAYSGRFSTSFVNEKTEFGYGGKSFTQSALLLEVEGEAKESLFDVFINDRFYGQATVGETISAPVRPYQTYDVLLKDKGTDFIKFDGGLKTVTLYPGNVKHLSWRAESLKVLIGQVTRLRPGCDQETEACWYPLINARVIGGHNIASTDEDGFLQVEVVSGTDVLELKRKDYECKVTLPSLATDDGIVYFDEPLQCIGEVQAPEQTVLPPECYDPANVSKIKSSGRVINFFKDKCNE